MKARRPAVIAVGCVKVDTELKGRKGRKDLADLRRVYREVFIQNSQTEVGTRKVGFDSKYLVNS